MDRQRCTWALSALVESRVSLGVAVIWTLAASAVSLSGCRNKQEEARQKTGSS